jgi:hypothetical protein
MLEQRQSARMDIHKNADDPHAEDCEDIVDENDVQAALEQTKEKWRQQK